MRLLKVIAVALGVIVAALAVLVLAVWLLFDPNDYKARIVAEVQAATGRELRLDGDVRLAVLPMLAVDIGPASLGNPRGFSERPFLTLKRASLHARLLPLLRGQVRVGRVVIDGLDLQLEQDRNGKGNWEDWGDQREPQRAVEGQSDHAASLDLAGVAITNGRVSFEDKEASELKATIGRVRAGASIPVRLEFMLQSGAPAKPVPIRMQFGVTVDLDRQLYALESLDLEGKLPNSAATPWRFTTAKLAMNLAQQTLDQAEYELELGPAQLFGNIQGASIVDAPLLAGDFELRALAPRKLLPALGLATPLTRDNSRLANLAAKGRYRWQAGIVEGNELDLKLDDSTLGGRMSFNTGTHDLDFALTLDRIDLDLYQPPPTAGGQGTPESAIELPVDTLKPLRARGQFDIGEIRTAGVQLQQLSVALRATGGQLRMAPLKAQLYGGRFAGDINWDLRGEVPKLDLQANLTGIDVARFGKDFAKSERITGEGDLSARLDARGRSGDAMLQSLNGTLRADLRNGAVDGIDIWYALAEAQSLASKRSLSGASNSRRTEFERFSASADLRNGVATTRDLVADSKELHVTGEGESNLLTSAIDYRIKARILAAPAGAGDGMGQLAGATIPVRISGTMAEPRIRPDLSGMVRERVQEKVDEQKQKLQEKVKEKLQDKLKNLFGN
ncbi:MAG: AsmA family protein [Steroidobacteraceae bacterium]